MPEINNIPTTQYIGPKIVPHVAKPVQWDSTKQYDALSIVMDEGNTYVARYIVPAGIPLSNTNYWVKFASWNAQVGVLQDVVDTFDERIEEVETLVPAEKAARIAADEALQTAINDEETARTSADTSMQDAITAEITARTSADTTLQDNIDTEEAARIAADEALQTSITTEISTEATARANADAAMQGSIDTLEEILPASAFSNVNTVQAAIENIVTHTMGKVLWFGDSFSLNNRLLNKVIAGMGHPPFENYSLSGIGYAYPDEQGHTLYTQAQLAVTEHPDPSDIEYVILYAGYNDANRTEITEQQYITGVQNTLDTLVAHFTTSKIIVIGLNTKYFNTPRTNPFTERLRTEARNRNLAFIDSHKWLLGFPSFFDSSQSDHPTSIGYSMIASHIVSALFGSNYEGDGRTPYIPASQVTTSNCSIYGDPYISINNGIFTFNARVDFSSLSPTPTLKMPYNVNFPASRNNVQMYGGLVNIMQNGTVELRRDTGNLGYIFVSFMEPIA